MSAEEASRIARAVQRVKSAKRGMQIALPTAAALGAGAAVAVGSIPGGDGTITGCYAGQNGAVLTVNGDGVVTEPAGSLRIVDPTLTIGGTPAGSPAPDPLASKCESQQETQVTWNQKGPQGPPGAPGAAGPQGPAGPSGGGETTFGLENKAGLTFLKLDGISGEAKDKQHKGDIEISSFSFGVSNQLNIGSQSSGAGAGKVTFNAFNITKKIDKASPLLFNAAASGKHIKLAELLFARKAGGKQMDYLYIKLTNVLISSVQDGSSSKGTPEERVSFAFQKMQETFINGNGKVGQTVNVNLSTNAKV
jgi:type VI secretion system Hcp family effector